MLNLRSVLFVREAYQRGELSLADAMSRVRALLGAGIGRSTE